jgi:hypothetical protein
MCRAWRRLQAAGDGAGQSGNVRRRHRHRRGRNPSFAPNSRLIVYATRQGGREALMTTTLDGKIKARLAGQGGDIREPSWGPVPAMIYLLCLGIDFSCSVQECIRMIKRHI